MIVKMPSSKKVLLFKRVLKTLLQVLGKGAFGVVYTAQDKQAPETYACKSIAKAKLVSEVRYF